MVSGYAASGQAARRAPENQIYVIQSPTVGEAPWSAALDVNIGAAAVSAPPDGKISRDGFLAEGTLNAAGWVYADLDLDLLAAVREDGEVVNFRDWDLQPGTLTLPEVTLVTLNPSLREEQGRGTSPGA